MNLKRLLNDALIDAVIQTFQSMTNYIPLPTEGNIEITSEDSIMTSISLVGIIKGDLELYISLAEAKKIVSIMLDKDVDEASASVTDGMCEVVNIMAGLFKKNLSKNKFSFEVSIPKAIKGTRISRCIPSQITVINQSFIYEAISFSAMLVYSINKSHIQEMGFDDIEEEKAFTESLRMLKDTLEP